MELLEFGHVIETGLVLKLPVLWGGIPLTVRLTLPVKPEEGVTVTRYWIFELLLAFCEEGDAITVKLPVAAPTVCVRPGEEVLPL